MSERPLFNPKKSPKHQSEEYYNFIDHCLVKVNKLRRKHGFSKLSRKALFRFVNQVYDNNWNAFLKSLNSRGSKKVLGDMDKYGIWKFDRQVQKARKKKQNKQVSVKSGFVYIVTNPIWPDWCKIGSAVNLQERLNSYQTSDPTRSFVVEHSVFVADRKKEEQRLLSFLKGKKVRVSGEWCNIQVRYILKDFKFNV